MNGVNNILFKKSKGRTRKLAVSMGAYDGRFAPKIVPNKRKAVYKIFRKNKHQVLIE